LACSTLPASSGAGGASSPAARPPVLTRACQAYRFHDLVHEHARHTAEDDLSPEHHADTRDRILRWYQHAARTAASAVRPARRELVYTFFSSSPVLPTRQASTTTTPRWPDWTTNAATWAPPHVKRPRPDCPALANLLADAMQPLTIIHKDDDTIAVDEVALDAAQVVLSA
jgi:hypothetical protein